MSQTATIGKSWRYAAAAVAVLVSVLAMLAFTGAPARATGDGVLSNVEFVDDCDGTTVTITSGKLLPSYEWTVTVADAAFWPGEVDAQPAPGESVEVLVPARAGQIEVDFAGSPRRGWPASWTWQHPGGDACGTPSVTVEGDCELVTVAFANPTEHYFSGDYRVDGEDGTADEWSQLEIEEGPHAGDLFGDRYQQVDLPPGQTELVELSFEPGSGEHLVEAVIRRGAEQAWYTEWTTLTVDCGQATPTPSVPPAAGGQGGGDQLPLTGASTPLVAGAGLALLTAGGALAMFVRRRRIRFEA